MGVSPHGGVSVSIGRFRSAYKSAMALLRIAQAG